MEEAVGLLAAFVVKIDRNLILIAMNVTFWTRANIFPAGGGLLRCRTNLERPFFPKSPEAAIFISC